MLHDSNLEVGHLSARTGVSVPSHEPDVTTRSFAASVVASLVTCRHVVPNRTRHCHTNQLVGSSSPKGTDSEMVEIRRKTHHRPGLHPPWSTRASFVITRITGIIRIAGIIGLLGIVGTIVINRITRITGITRRQRKCPYRAPREVRDRRQDRPAGQWTGRIQQRTNPQRRLSYRYQGRDTGS